jgi:hypothetical protein
MPNARPATMAASDGAGTEYHGAGQPMKSR